MVRWLDILLIGSTAGRISVWKLPACKPAKVQNLSAKTPHLAPIIKDTRPYFSPRRNHSITKGDGDVGSA